MYLEIIKILTTEQHDPDVYHNAFIDGRLVTKRGHSNFDHLALSESVTARIV